MNKKTPNKVLVKKLSRPMGLQAVFNRIYKWAHTHDRCVSESNGDCANRNKYKTNACYVGCLIPDVLYEDIGETVLTNVFITLIRHNVLIKSFDYDNLDFLRHIHDRNSSKHEKIESLKEFARIRKLKIPKV